MAANFLSSKGMAGLIEGLPPLICETNLEKQLDSIEKWLNPYLPVQSVGLSISGIDTESENEYTVNVQENLVKEIEKKFAENGGERPTPTTEKSLLFLKTTGLWKFSHQLTLTGRRASMEWRFV